MSSHIIIYVDQNYLSNMAKARIGSIKDKDQASFWLSLFDDLKKAVLADKVACPQLEFQRHESMYDRMLEEPIRKVIDELSWGLEFHHSTDILESQIYDAAKSFLGKQLEQREPWTIAFKSNPQASVESRITDIWGVKGQLSVHLTLSDEIVEHDRQLKKEYVKGEEFFTKLGNTYHKWEDLVFAEKLSFVVSFFGLQAQNTIYRKLRSDSWLENFVAVSLHAELTRRWEELGEIGVDVKNTTTAADFLESNELLNIPYIDIFCSINASIIKFFSDRKCKGSDLNNVAMLATVLPYCDIVSTDSFMKEILVKKLHFDDKYKARIFSATKADRLAFQKLIKASI